MTDPSVPAPVPAGFPLRPGRWGANYRHLRRSHARRRHFRATRPTFARTLQRYLIQVFLTAKARGMKPKLLHCPASVNANATQRISEHDLATSAAVTVATRHQPRWRQVAPDRHAPGMPRRQRPGTARASPAQHASSPLSPRGLEFGPNRAQPPPQYQRSDWTQHAAGHRE